MVIIEPLKTLIGLLLTAVGAPKFGFGALIATFWGPFGLLFTSVWRHDFRKI